MPCFTKGGSFWTNASSELLALAPEDDPRTNPRNRCIDAGYQSVALIPLRSGDEIIGLLQLNDRRGGRLTLDRIRLFEGLGASIGIALKRKQAEEALRESEERFRRFADAAFEGIVIHERGKILDVNSAFAAMFGYEPAEVIGMNVLDVAAPEARDLVERNILSEYEQPYEGIGLRKDGSTFVNELRGKAIPYQGRSVRITGLRDITERKRAEEEKDTLLAIAQDISGTFDLDTLLDRVLRRTAAALPCDRIVTYYWDATRKVYRAIAWYGVPAELVPETIAMEFRPGQTVVEYLATGQTLLINDVGKQEWVPLEVLTHFRLGALILVPFVVRVRQRGTLAAYNNEGGRRFDARQVKLFEGIARQVGMAVEAAELYRAQHEEAVVRGALARVGQELISSLSTPRVLDRLCQLTTEVLGCDTSRTWLWHAPDEAFIPVASYGDSPEQWEIIRLFRFGRSALAAQLEGMERDGFFNTKIADLPDSEARAWARAYGMTAGLMVPLRRGGELVGFHTADYHGRDEVLGERHERIARGIGQLASLALENVRLIDELERANRLKSDFVATMSHELRTPLNIIMGYNDLLLDGGFGPMTEEQVDTLQRIEKSAEELLELITATLDLSRLDTGQVQLDVKAIDLADLVSELDSEISGLRENPNVDFAWDVAPELPELRSDPAKLKVVLKNLIGNAIKFTHAGDVVVRLRARDGGVEITVADTGVGIAREMLPVIFEPFRQGEPAMTREYRGVGLGLYIVRRILDMLGGTIDAESNVGQGSTFRVWVPSRVAA